MHKLLVTHSLALVVLPLASATWLTFGSSLFFSDALLSVLLMATAGGATAVNVGAW